MAVIVVDTNILCHVRDLDDISCLKVIKSIKRMHYIALDDTEVIIEEYKRNKVFTFDTSELVLSPFWKHMISKGKLVVKTPYLQRKHRNYLLQNGFDDTDLIFIEVANMTKDRVIITNDSDFGIADGQPAKHPQILGYLTNDVKIQIVSSERAHCFISENS